MKMEHYISKLKSAKRRRDEKESPIKILIPAGTEIHAGKLTKTVPRIIEKDIKTKVLQEDDYRYTFKLPKAAALSWVEKNKVKML